MKYAYPAVFSKEGDAYNVSFPDFPECLTFGVGLADAISMAEDVLCFHLHNLEEQKKEIPAPIDIASIATDEVVLLVSCDTLKYREDLDD